MKRKIIAIALLILAISSILIILLLNPEIRKFYADFFYFALTAFPMIFKVVFTITALPLLMALLFALMKVIAGLARGHQERPEDPQPEEQAPELVKPAEPDEPARPQMPTKLGGVPPNITLEELYKILDNEEEMRRLMPPRRGYSSSTARQIARVIAGAKDIDLIHWGPKKISELLPRSKGKPIITPITVSHYLDVFCKLGIQTINGNPVPRGRKGRVNSRKNA